MNDEQTIITDAQPPDFFEIELRKAFANSFAAQSTLMDGVAQQLLLAELAVPGLYATALQLTQGENVTVTLNGWVVAAFVLWLAALALTLHALFPGKWRVDPDKLESDEQGLSKKIGIKNFFRDSAIYKRNRLIPAIAVFFLGIICATLASVL